MDPVLVGDTLPILIAPPEGPSWHAPTLLLPPKFCYFLVNIFCHNHRVRTCRRAARVLRGSLPTSSSVRSLWCREGLRSRRVDNVSKMTDAAPAKAEGREVGFAVDEEVRDRRVPIAKRADDDKELSHPSSRRLLFVLIILVFSNFLLPSRTSLRRWYLPFFSGAPHHVMFSCVGTGHVCSSLSSPSLSRSLSLST